MYLNSEERRLVDSIQMPLNPFKSHIANLFILCVVQIMCFTHNKEQTQSQD